MPHHDYTAIDKYVAIVEEKTTNKQQKILSGFIVIIICEAVVEKILVRTVRLHQQECDALQ